MIVIIGSYIHWLRYMLTYVYKVWIEYIWNIMFCYICYVIFTNFINNIFFSLFFCRIILFYWGIILFIFTISLKLSKFAGKILYFCLPNWIGDKISKLWVEFMGHFILSNKWIIVLPFLDICTNLTWNPWFSCIFRR